MDTSSPAGNPAAAFGPVVPPEAPALSLTDLGWDDGFQSTLESERQHLAAQAHLVRPGRVVRRDRNLCLVATEGGLCPVSVPSRLAADPLEAPTTGDFVAVVGEEIGAVLERRTVVMRAAFRDLSAQVLAANVDTVLAVSPVGARWRPRRLERLLVIAWQTGAVPVVVLTKSDCCADAGEAYTAAAAVAPGCAVHVVSALTGEGMDDLAAELAPRTTSVMIGPSGAGKSTLANALGAGDVHLATAEIRADGKGRHTTVARELVRLANGALLIDTPGLRAIGLWDAEEALSDAFSDVEALAAGCKFRDCAHNTEPACAVKEAIAEGHLDAERLESYRRLQREQRRLAARTDARLRAERSAEQKAFNKYQRSIFYR